MEVLPGEPGPGRALASRVAAVPEPVPALGTGDVVGVDRGVAAAVALSTGELSSPVGLRPKEAERLRRLRRRLARARKGSNRRAKVNPGAGRALAARGDQAQSARSVKREPQLLAS